MALELLAPAKLNLTLEILGRREDGYHEVRSIMQTISLTDRVRISESPELELLVVGPEAGGAPEAMPENLAYRAATVLQQAAGRAAGARIELEKHIPAAAGLGGGSSDAAAVLRGLNRLWGLSLPIQELAAIGARLGSDVPFFLHGGAAFASGTGTDIEPLGSASGDITLFVSPGVSIPDKTRRMYSGLRSEDYGDGSCTEALRRSLSEASDYSSWPLTNAFDRVVGEVEPTIGEAMARCRAAGVPVLIAGAGPTFFAPRALHHLPDALKEELRSRYGVEALATSFLSAAEALVITEV